jgi:hypothetical protein
VIKVSTRIRRSVIKPPVMSVFFPPNHNSTGIKIMKRWGFMSRSGTNSPARSGWHMR